MLHIKLNLNPQIVSVMLIDCKLLTLSTPLKQREQLAMSSCLAFRWTRKHQKVAIYTDGRLEGNNCPGVGIVNNSQLYTRHVGIGMLCPCCHVMINSFILCGSGSMTTATTV